MPGQAGMAKVTVGSTGGFTGTVTFTCKVLPASSLAPACSLSPTQVTLTSGGKTTSILTVNTTAATALLARPHLGRGLVPVYAMVFPILGATLLGVGFTSNGRRKGLVGLMMCCLLIGGLAFQMACGGGEWEQHRRSGHSCGELRRHPHRECGFNAARNFGNPDSAVISWDVGLCRKCCCVGRSMLFIEERDR